MVWPGMFWTWFWPWHEMGAQAKGMNSVVSLSLVIRRLSYKMTTVAASQGRQESHQLKCTDSQKITRITSL